MALRSVVARSALCWANWAFSSACFSWASIALRFGLWQDPHFDGLVGPFSAGLFKRRYAASWQDLRPAGPVEPFPRPFSAGPPWRYAELWQDPHFVGPVGPFPRPLSAGVSVAPR